MTPEQYDNYILQFNSSVENCNFKSKIDFANYLSGWIDSLISTKQIMYEESNDLAVSMAKWYDGEIQ